MVEVEKEKMKKKNHVTIKSKINRILNNININSRNGKSKRQKEEEEEERKKQYKYFVSQMDISHFAGIKTEGRDRWDDASDGEIGEMMGYNGGIRLKGMKVSNSKSKGGR